MKLSKQKTTLSLMLAVALLAGLLSGCQWTPTGLGNTGANTIPSSDEFSSPTQSTTEEDARQNYIGDFPPGWIPPEWIESWENGWAAVPNDTYYTVDLQWAIDKIQLPNAWDITTGSGTIRVGVIDSGVDASHPELQNRVNEELSESFVSGVSPLDDPAGHGTHVAGIIAAQGNNGSGSTGVCWDVEIVSLRVSGNDNIPQPSAVADAIESANDKGIHILNLSLTLSGISTAEYSDLYNAIADFEGLVICAAGNSGTINDHRANNDLFEIYPCNIRLSNLISVGASTNTDTMWDYSHYGATMVDIFAPGNSIMNCYPSDLCVDGACDSFTHNANGYHLMSGTSMAAPHVAGVAALLLSIHPELTPAELKQVIMDNVDVILDISYSSVFGDLCVSGGRLNAYKALTDSSIHNFGRWLDRDSTYHSRTCSTCGYVEMRAHADSWDSLRSICTACNRTGTITQPYAYPPTVDVANACDDGCANGCA